MKKFAFILLILSLLLSMAACGRGNIAGKPTQTQMESRETVPGGIQTEPESISPPDVNPPENDEDFEVFRNPKDIYIYPFQKETLATAAEVAQTRAELCESEAGILTFSGYLAYDPILTDITVRQNIAAGLLPEQTESYSGCLAFTLVYSASYDHTKTFLQDTEKDTFCMILSRETAQSPWEVADIGAAPSVYMDAILDPAELGQFGENTVAAYALGDNTYMVYRQDSGNITFSEEHLNPAIHAVWDESDYQVGLPVIPQPGDTAGTWVPTLADSFPDDGACTDMELLEKWMTVEGLTLTDLEARQCEQLVLVVADGSDEAKIVCFEKLSTGTWVSVDSLSRMNGWVGSGGIQHDRQRNSHTSPAGLWSLGTAFGNSERPENLKMPWRTITPNSDWVCDEDSPYFNSWQEKDDPMLSYDWGEDVEHLENYTSAYAYACVIRFNTAPYTIPNRGCAIFFHCGTRHTDGCVALPEEDFTRVLLWMAPERHPFILITGIQKGQ